MDLAQLFNPVEKIVGMEIAHGRVCMVLLEKDTKGIVRGTNKEVAISPDIIAPDGTVREKQKLAGVLKTIWQTSKDVFKSHYVILTLPSAAPFIDIVKFPKVDQEQLEESIKLNLSTKTLFPINVNDIYYDWQRVISSDVYHERVLLAFAGKEHIHDYVTACETAGLHLLAVETPPLSCARAMTNFKNKAGLVVRISEESIELFAVKENDLLFCRRISLPDTYTFDALKTIVKDEAFKSLNYYDTENQGDAPLASIVLLSRVPQKNEIAAYLGEQLGIAVENARFIYDTALSDSSAAAFGTALRGLITREEDTLISLMPIGTEEAYRTRRFLAYVSLWSDIINATAALLVLLFCATWIFSYMMSKNVAQQAAQLKVASAANAKIAELEQHARRFNAAIAYIASAERTIYPWSSSIEKIIPALMKDGLAVHAIILSSPSTPVMLRVTAATRDGAISFRKALENNPLFSQVTMPPLGIEQKENITLDIALTVLEK